MKPRVLIPSLASVIAGIAIGWLAGSGRGDGGLKHSNRAAAGTNPTRRDASAGEGSGLHRDFASYLKRVEGYTSHPEAERAVARMSREELQALLLETPERDWNREFKMSEHLRRKVSDAAAAELLRRDGIAAVDWAEASACRGAWTAMIRALAFVDPAAAKEKSTAYYAALGAGSSRDLAIQALNGAASRSAKDMIECIKYWDDLISFEYITEYVPGFDFGAVVASIEAIRDNARLREMPKHLVAAWAAADPDAAAAAMIKGLSSDAHNWTECFGQALTARAGMVGEDAAGEWMAGVLKQVPDSKRYSVLSTLFDRDISTARANGLIAHLEDRDRIELAFISADLYSGSYGHRQTLSLIRAMPSEELKMEALHEIARRTIRDRAPDSTAWRMKELESLMDKLQLSDAEMQKVFASAAK